MKPKEAALEALKAYGTFVCAESIRVYAIFYKLIGEEAIAQEISKLDDEYQKCGVWRGLDISDEVHSKYGAKLLRTFRALAKDGSVQGFWIGCRYRGTFDGLPRRIRCYGLPELYR